MKKKFNSYLNYVTNWWHDEKQVNLLKRFGFIDDESYNKLLEAIKIIDEVYHDHWDINLEYYWDYISEELHKNVYFIIYFPEVTIKNSRREEHTIYDLYTKVGIISDCGFRISSIQGVKLTYSFAEFQSRYAHSHLSTVDFSRPPRYGGFCTGSGVINQVQMMFNSSDGFDENLFKMYLFEIKQYIEWESIEGGPFCYMSGVRMRGSNHSLRPIPFEIINSYVKDFKDHLPFCKFDTLNLELDKFNNISIVDDEQFEEFLVSTVNYNRKTIYCSKDDEGNYVQIEENAKTPMTYSEDESIVFKGKAHGYKVDINIVSKPQKMYVNPIIKNVCKSILEYEFSKEQIKSFCFR